MSVSLRDVVLAVGYGDASLVGESAGYLILGAADAAIRTCEQASLDSITINDEGVVRLQGVAADEDDAERALRHLLGALLRKVRIPSTNLDRVASRAELRGLRSLVAELEAALVPVNRKAARRTLARLCRESKKSAAKERQFAEVVEVPEAEFAPPPAPVIESEPAPVVAPSPPAPVAVQPVAVEQIAVPSANNPPAPAAVQQPSTPPELEVAAPTRACAPEPVPALAPSRLPTVPARPDPRLLAVAGAIGYQTPTSNPVLVAPAPAPVNPVAYPVGGPEAEVHQLGDRDFEEVDDLDEAPTLVFAGVATASQVVMPKAKSRAPVLEDESAARRRRRRPLVPRRSRGLTEEESLIVMSESAPRRRPSDIEDLLDKMSVAPMSTDELFVGLKTLSRVELSPVAPPVGASWIDDDNRK